VVIFCAFFGAAKGCVGFGDLNEARGGIRIIGVAVGVMGFGESVE
jgi:hypothetical protein